MGPGVALEGITTDAHGFRPGVKRASVLPLIVYGENLGDCPWRTSARSGEKDEGTLRPNPKASLTPFGHFGCRGSWIAPSHKFNPRGSCAGWRLVCSPAPGFLRHDPGSHVGCRPKEFVESGGAFIGDLGRRAPATAAEGSLSGHAGCRRMGRHQPGLSGRWLFGALRRAGFVVLR